MVVVVAVSADDEDVRGSVRGSVRWQKFNHCMHDISCIERYVVASIILEGRFSSKLIIREEAAVGAIIIKIQSTR